MSTQKQEYSQRNLNGTLPNDMDKVSERRTWRSRLQGIISKCKMSTRIEEGRKLDGTQSEDLHKISARSSERFHIQGIMFKSRTSTLKLQESSRKVDGTNSKDLYKVTAWSSEKSHIQGIISKCRFVPTGNTCYVEHIEKCLEELNSLGDEISQILRAVNFSLRVTFCVFDFERTDLTRLAGQRALGWYLDKQGELLLGAKELLQNADWLPSPEEQDDADHQKGRKGFIGTLAHELAHWCMETVFVNKCRPYFSSDPLHKKEVEFRGIVDTVYQFYVKNGEDLDVIIRSVFMLYENRAVWPQELIVRIPQMIAYYGKDEALVRLGRYQPTQKLFLYYQNYVLTQLRTYVLDAPLLPSRQSIKHLNDQMTLLRWYLECQMGFIEPMDININSGSVLYTLSSPHPYLTYLHLCWTLNCEEPTDRFYGNNLFCSFEEFEGEAMNIISTFRELGECKALVLVCPKLVDKKSIAAMKPIFHILSQRHEKKVFLVVPDTQSSVLGEVLKTSPFKSEVYKVKELNLNDLDEMSKNGILEYNVHFQGDFKPLNTVIGEDEFHLVDGKCIEEICSRQDIVIGRLSSLRMDLPPNFVWLYERIGVGQFRGLIRSVYDNNFDVRPIKIATVIIGESYNYNELLRQDMEELFNCRDIEVLESPDSPQESNFPILFVTTVSESDYRFLSGRLRKMYSSDVVYFIRIKSKNAILCELLYYHDLSLLRNLEVTKSKRMRDGNVIFEDTFGELLRYGSDRVMMISDVAGTGKSKFLNIMYDNMSNNSSDNIWVFKCSLKDYEWLLDDYESEPTIDDLKHFISHITRCTSRFDKQILNFRMFNRTSKPIVLLLDGMDEIKTEAGGMRRQRKIDSSTMKRDNNVTVENGNKKKMVRFISMLQEHTNLRAVVTTRPEADEDLSLLDCPTFKFTPLALDDCKSYHYKIFFARCLLSSKTSIPHERLQSEVNKYCEKLAPDILAVPLHISMISDILTETIKETSTGSFEAVAAGLNGVEQLYHEFVDLKYQVYFGQKKNTSMDKRLRNHMNEVFQCLAFYYLYREGNFFSKYGSFESYFPNNELFHLHENKLTVKFDEVAKYTDIGFVFLSTSDRSKIEFVHPTFAEYFVSTLFISWITRAIHREAVFNEILFKRKGSRAFFDPMLKHAELANDVMKEYGIFMATMVTKVNNIRKHLSGLIENDYVNSIDFILKCFTLAGKINQLVDPDTYDEFYGYYYPTFHAALIGSTEMVKMLLNYFPVDISCNGNSIIRFLLQRGKRKLLMYLMDEKNIVIEGVNYSAIHLATSSGNKQLVSWLESRGFDVFSLYQNKYSTFHYAVSTLQLEMAKWLNGRGVSNIPISDSGDTAVHVAVSSSKPRWIIPSCVKEKNPYCTDTDRLETMLKWLIAEGLELNRENSKGESPIHTCAINGELAYIKVLCKLGVRPGEIISSKRGWNTLHYAVAHSKLSVIQWLLSNGCNLEETTTKGVNAFDIEGENAIHIALKQQAWNESVKWILDQPFDLTRTVPITGNGYLHYAVKCLDKRFIQILLSKGCDVNCQNLKGETALHIAVCGGGLEQIQISYDSKTDMHAVLHYDPISKSFMLNVFRSLVSYEYDSDKNTGKVKQHHNVAMSDDQAEQCISWLWEQNSESTKMVPLTGGGLLHYAVHSFDSNVGVLLENSCDIGVRDFQGKTAAHLIIDKLITNDANISIISSLLPGKPGMVEEYRETIEGLTGQLKVCMLSTFFKNLVVRMVGARKELLEYALNVKADNVDCNGISDLISWLKLSKGLEAIHFNYKIQFRSTHPTAFRIMFQPSSHTSINDSQDVESNILGTFIIKNLVQTILSNDVFRADISMPLIYSSSSKHNVCNRELTEGQTHNKI